MMVFLAIFSLENHLISYGASIMSNKYRFIAQLQSGTDNLATSDQGEFDRPPSAEEAIAIVATLKSSGEDELPKGAHKDFNKALVEVIAWIESNRRYNPGKNGDISPARRKFKYGGQEYRVDIKVGGKTSGDPWFS
jgi:hypothetical protein